MIDGVKPFRWTAEGFYLELDAGAFLDRRVQLIDTVFPLPLPGATIAVADLLP